MGLLALMAVLSACQEKVVLESYPENYSGVGIELTVEGNFPKVVRALAGGPSEELGLTAGDKLVAIDGETTEGLSLGEVVHLLRGPTGSTVELTVLTGDGTRTLMQVTRAKVEVKTAAR